MTLNKSFKLNSNHTLEQWYQLSVKQRNEFNLGVVEEKIYTWQQLHQLSTSGVKLDLNNHLIFFHIFKTAGTTLSRLISKNYRINNMLHANAPVMDASPEILNKLGSCIRVMMGHIELNDVLYQFLDRERLVHITLLREPLERVVSYYDHIKSRKRHLLHDQVKHMSLVDFIECDLVNDVNNGQTYRLLGLLKQQALSNDGRTEKQLLNDAKTLLDEKFSIVGTTDEFDAFLLSCHKLLNWPDIYYQKLNQSASKTTISSIKNSVIEKIYQLNQIDLKLYHYVKELSQKRSQVLGVSAAELLRFSENNKKFNALTEKTYGL